VRILVVDVDHQIRKLFGSGKISADVIKVCECVEDAIFTLVEEDFDLVLTEFDFEDFSLIFDLHLYYINRNQHY